MPPHRRDIPSFDFHEYGRADLRRHGIMVIPMETSFVLDPRRLHPHSHDFFQIFWMSGTFTLMHDFRDYQCQDHTVVLVSPGQVHTLSPGPGVTGVQVSFTQEFFDHDSLPPGRLAALPFFFGPAASVPCFPVPADDPHGIGPAFSSLLTEYTGAAPWAEEALRAWLQVLMVRLRRLHAAHQPADANPRAAAIVRQFLASVETRFREKWTLGQYAASLGLTPNHLNDTVSRQTGQSAGAHLRRRILLEARRLLLHSDLTVSEITWQLGFPDPSYFSRFFRRGDGRAPLDFRREIREKYRSNSA